MNRECEVLKKRNQELETELGKLKEDYMKLQREYVSQQQELNKLEQELRNLRQSKFTLSPAVRQVSSNILISNIFSSTGPLKPFKPIQTHKMFEEYLALGIDSSAQPNPGVLARFPSESVVSPEILLSFAFPSGYQVKPMDMRHSCSEVYRLMFPTIQRDSNSYVFTVNSVVQQEPFGFPTMANDSKEVLYICCVLEYIVSSPDKVFVAQAYPICHCLVSYVPCFELHFQMLYALLAVRKSHSMLHGSQSLSLSSEQIQLLRDYQSDFTLRPKRRYSIQPETVAAVDIRLPNDFYFLDIEWTCPLMFSSLTLNQLMLILSAALQEYSLVFCSANLGKVSSCVLGVQALIKPFKWRFVATPVLPEQLLTILESPVPILVGVKEIPTSFIAPASMIVIHLGSSPDKNQMKMTAQVPLFTHAIGTELKNSYVLFDKLRYETDHNLSRAVHIISREIQKYWAEINDLIIAGAATIPQKAEATTIIRSLILEQSDLNRDFLRGFVNSQLFVSALDQALYTL